MIATGLFIPLEVREILNDVSGQESRSSSSTWPSWRTSLRTFIGPEAKIRHHSCDFLSVIDDLTDGAIGIPN